MTSEHLGLYNNLICLFNCLFLEDSIFSCLWDILKLEFWKSASLPAWEPFKMCIEAKTPPVSHPHSLLFLSHHFRPRGSSYGWPSSKRLLPNSTVPTLPCRRGVPSRAWLHSRGPPATPSCSRSAPPTPGRNPSIRTWSGPRCLAPRRLGKKGFRPSIKRVNEVSERISYHSGFWWGHHVEEATWRWTIPSTSLWVWGRGMLIPSWMSEMSRVTGKQVHEDEGFINTSFPNFDSLCVFPKTIRRAYFMK